MEGFGKRSRASLVRTSRRFIGIPLPVVSREKRLRTSSSEGVCACFLARHPAADPFIWEFTGKNQCRRKSTRIAFLMEVVTLVGNMTQSTPYHNLMEVIENGASHGQ